MNYEKLILDTARPLVENKDALMVRQMPNEDGKGLLFLVVASSSDIARLIGKKGIIAKAIREVVNVAAKIAGERVFVKFESFEEEI